MGLSVLLVAAGTAGAAEMAKKPSSGKPPTVAEAKAFVEEAEARILKLTEASSHAGWVQATYITHDTEILAAKASEELINAGVEYAKQATRYDKLKLSLDIARKMRLLKLGLTLAAPADPKESEEVTRIAVSLESRYGKGKYCREGTDKCLDVGAITKIMAESRDPKELLDVWKGWHTISPPMRPEYERFVALANKGARELGFADAGAMWRSKYDMPPDEFAKEVDRLWEQVKHRAGDGSPPGAPARKHLGSGLVERLRARRAEGRRPRLRPDADPEGEEGGREGDGSLRRALLHFPGL
jgi:peptidyl-dipeptidase A